MPVIRRNLVLVGLLAASLVGCVLFLKSPPEPDAAASGLDPEKLKRLDTLLQDAVDHQAIAGGVMLLAQHGRISHLQGIGWRDAESRTPMTTDTLFRIVSLTKPITCVAAMMLVEEGKLRLDQPVSDFIPELKNVTVGVPNLFGWGLQARPVKHPITIRELLNQTAGFTYRFWDIQPWSSLYRQAGISDGLMHTPGTCRENVRRLANAPLMFQPGTIWGYGLSIDVLGVVIEAASGKDLETFFRERIFEPLKMHDSFFYVPELKRDRLASVYVPDREGRARRVGNRPVTVGEMEFSATYPCEKDGKYFSGGGGLVSTATDYARFLQMLLNGGELDGVRLLNPLTVREMTSSQIGGYLKTCFPQYGDSYGYGFGVLTVDGKNMDVASIGTYSWGGLFNTYFWVDPRKELFGILLVQLFTIGDLPLRQEFKKRAYASLVATDVSSR